jgi:predicted dehydrogenase
MVGFNRRFSPAARRVKEIIANRQNPLMIMYRMNAGYMPPDHWTQTAEGGGRIIGEACHILDLFQYIVGARVAEVSTTTIAPLSGHMLAEDNFTAVLRYSDGSVASLLYTALGPPGFSKEYMELYVEGSVLVLDDYRSLHTYGTKAPPWNASVQDKGHLEELRYFSRHARRENVLVDLAMLVETTALSLKISHDANQ